MNRHERRRAFAERKKKAEAVVSLPPARGDGRPQFYDINEGDRVQCFECLRNGIDVLHNYKYAAMSDPANPPKGCKVGDMHTVCVHHLPDNAVIYDPVSDRCRNKSGDHTWTETQ